MNDFILQKIANEIGLIITVDERGDARIWDQCVDESNMRRTIDGWEVIFEDDFDIEKFYVDLPGVYGDCEDMIFFPGE